MQLHLKKFDLAQIEEGKNILLIARRNSGKTTIILDILFHKRDIPIGTVICPTETSNGTYSSHVPSLFIHKEYKPQLIENIIKRQKKIIKKMKKEEMLYGKSSVDPRAFLVMDDMMFDDSWKKDRNIKYIFANGRHEKLTFILSLQYLKGIGPSFRTNADYIFILREPMVSNRRLIYESFAGIFPTFESFCTVLDQTTEDYECLVIDNNSRSNKLEDQIYWYKADMHDDFRIGCREFWQLHNEFSTKSDDEEEEEMFDVKSLVKKKPGPAINVRKNY